MGKTIIKALILDLGGVIFENGTKVTIQHLNEKFGINKQLLGNIFCGDLSWELRKGKISYRHFWDTIYSTYPDFYQEVNNEAELFWHSAYTVKQPILQILSKAKSSYTIGAISGNIKERIEFLEDRYGFSKLLDFALYSFDSGEDKLNPKLYAKAVRELEIRGILPEESLFVDDNLDCLETARALGFKTYLFRNIETFLANNPELGIVE